MNSISNDSVLNVFRQNTCVDLRRLAVQLGVETTNAALAMVIGNLKRNRKIRRIGGKGRHASFVLATFEG
jgi:hypothetical protein